MAVVAITVWLIVTGLAVGAPVTVFIHYFLISFPPLTLLAAWEVTRIQHAYEQRFLARQRFLNYLPAVLIIAISLFMCTSGAHTYYKGYFLYRTGQESREHFLRSTPLGDRYLHSAEVAGYVVAHTRSDDEIYIWSDDIDIYYISDRRSALDLIWPLYAEASGSYQQIFGPQTKYIVVGESTLLDQPAWFWQGLTQSYTQETQIGEDVIYRYAGDAP